MFTLFLYGLAGLLRCVDDMTVRTSEKLGRLFILIVISILFFSVLGPVCANLERGDMVIDDLDRNEITDDDLNGTPSADVPTWKIGSYWTYENLVWMNNTEEERYLHFEDVLDLKVDSIEHIDHQGETYLAYNISIKGEIVDGHIETQHFDINIEGGYIEGYNLLRMSDLAVVENRRLRYYHGQGPFGELEGWSYMNQSYSSPAETYDFTINIADSFWANTTIHEWGYNRIEVGDNTQEDHIDEDTNSLRETTVDTKENVQVPAGKFDCYYMTSTISGDSDGTHEIWYNPDIGMSVKEVSHLEQGDMRRILTDYQFHETSNELTIEPSEAEVGEEVTLSGQFPDDTNQIVIIDISQGAEPRDAWETTTDEDGYFEKVIEVPMAEDMTETTYEFSSVGLIAQIDGVEDRYAVATLSIHHDNKPMFPEPKDGTYGVSLDPELSVIVGHQNGVEMDVYFYDSDGDLIGSEESVSSGDYARTTWSDLEPDSTYEWYAVAEDGVENYDSETWSFTTVGGAKFDVYVASPEDGENFVEGDKITVDYEVENTGISEGTQDIVFTVYDDTGKVYEDTYSAIQLGPGEDYSSSFTWQGDAGIYDMVVNSDDDKDERTVTVLGSYELTVGVDGSGTTDPAPGDYTHIEGEEVTINANPDEGWYFDGWGGTDKTGDEITVTMNEDKAITAFFQEKSSLRSYHLTADVDGEGSVDPTEGIYHDGDMVTVEATPADGWKFVEWTGNVPEDEEGLEIKITMDENRSITAHFEKLVAEFEVTHFDVEENGLELNITAYVENVGNAEGSLGLMIEGEEVESITLGVGEADDFEYTHEFEEEGEYTIELSHQIETVNVEELGKDDESDGDNGTPGFDLILMLSGLSIALTAYKYKKRRP